MMSHDADRDQQTPTSRQPRAKQRAAHDARTPKYTIAVASSLSGVPQQQLRRMEDGGLVSPSRTQGNTRRYSDRDLERIAEVSALAEEGINLAGIHRVLELSHEVDALRQEVAELRAELRRFVARERNG